ncbi:MAG: pyridoxamine 5'-phosphate oxidase-related FMN-binding protein [Paracoccaceae bacterium]|nr:MAG: pyridoxamine 5'-phosphate oxidase-related FMN-binding protein [Paracoccaceae bacterium]
MRIIDGIGQLEALYGKVNPLAIAKVARRLTPLYARWVAASRFAILATVGPDGTDCSPRGEDGPVVRIADPQTLLLPDWPGNNRLDSLRNIVRDGRASLMFLVPGSDIVIRTNGRAVVTDDPDVTARFERSGRRPRSVIVFRIGEVYFQCAKALMRAGLWSAPTPEGLPSAGQLLREADGSFDDEAFDRGFPDLARDSLW